MNLKNAACASASLSKASLWRRRLHARLNHGGPQPEALNLAVDKTS